MMNGEQGRGIAAGLGEARRPQVGSLRGDMARGDRNHPCCVPILDPDESNDD
jgi:hypothetical protein